MKVFRYEAWIFMTFVKKILILSFVLLAVGIGVYTIKTWKESKQESNLEISTSDPQEEIEFALFTMPKTGTHLMRPLLEYLTDKYSTSYWSREIDCPKVYLYDKKMMKLLLSLPDVVQPYWLNQPIHKNCLTSILDNLYYENEFFVTHAPYSPEIEKLMKERKAVVFFLIRDPRDWIISVIRHPAVSGVDIYGEPFGDHDFLSLDMNEKIHHVINGTSSYYSAKEVINKFLPWKKSSICCTLRFEALLGPQGGIYSQKEQLAELRKITNALHLDVSDEMLLEAFNESFGTGSMFSKGKAGTWKEYFNEEHKKAFKVLLGDILIELGYEKDYNW